MEEKGIGRKLKTRINEIYKETRNKIRVNGEMSEKFWTRGLRQGCPLSSTLLALYTADLEERMRRGQAGGVVIGRIKFWSLTYADDIVLLAKTPKELKEMMGRMKYLDSRELNANQSKLLIFKRGRSLKKKEDWKWGEEVIEEVKDFIYLGYHFQNGGTEIHMRETVKKTMMAMKQTRRIGERRFKNNYMRRMKIFESIVKCIMLYATEIWG